MQRRDLLHRKCSDSKRGLSSIVWRERAYAADLGVRRPEEGS